MTQPWPLVRVLGSADNWITAPAHRRPPGAVDKRAKTTGASRDADEDAYLSTKQIAGKRALTALMFLLQPEVISTVAAY